VIDVIPLDTNLLQTYADFSRLPRTLAVIYETLRLHPAVVYIPKYATEDTWLPDDPDVATEGEVVSFRLLEQVSANVTKARYWKKPNAFQPERFLEDYNRDAFAPFSAGARGESIIHFNSAS
jgi:cytochrome P450